MKIPILLLLISMFGSVFLVIFLYPAKSLEFIYSNWEMAFTTLIATGAGGVIASWVAAHKQSKLFQIEQRIIKERFEEEKYLSDERFAKEEMVIRERQYATLLLETMRVANVYKDKGDYSAIDRYLHDLLKVAPYNSPMTLAIRLVRGLVSLHQIDEDPTAKEGNINLEDNLMKNFDVLKVVGMLDGFTKQSLVMFLTDGKKLNDLFPVVAELTIFALTEEYGDDMRRLLLDLHGTPNQKSKYQDVDTTEERYIELISVFNPSAL